MYPSLCGKQTSRCHLGPPGEPHERGMIADQGEDQSTGSFEPTSNTREELPSPNRREDAMRWLARLENQTRPHAQ